MKKKILVIDDSESNLLLINSIFEEDNEIEVIVESNSSKALADIKKTVPDLILLDLMMPHIDGFQLLDKIKGDVEISSIPIIIVSARLDSEAKKITSKYGVVDYIEKPISLDLIEEKIYKIFNNFVA
ncbi:MAG: response regulator [Bacteroidales bacterium]|nr:response regulator [Bacteroidales bacterium]